jgi:hypothetical protein
MGNASARLLGLIDKRIEARQRETVAERLASLTGDLARPHAPEWVAGAEPVIMCLSCNHEFPAGSEERCLGCGVMLTVVHRCPTCERLQSLEHLSCFYCRTPLVVSPPALPLLTPARNPYERGVRRWLRVGARIITPQLAVAVLILLILAGSFSNSKTTSRFSLLDKTPMGHSYVLNHASLRQEASLQAPVVTQLRSREVVDIFDCASDALGNHWFGVISRGSKSEGYVLVQDVAPPRATDPEKGARALRHSLLVLGSPAALPAAEAAVEYYQDVFPSSTHVDELRWLLAERKQRLGRHPKGRRGSLTGEEGFYVDVALASDNFADSAPEAPAQLLPQAKSASSRHSSRLSRGRARKTGRSGHSAPLKMGVVGGSLSSPNSGPSPASAATSAGGTQ